MSDSPSWSDLFRIARDEILARQAAISRDAVERDGSDANVIVASASAIGDEVIGQVIDAQSGLFLDSAEDTALDKLVYDRYQILRKAAAPAVGYVNFSTVSSSHGAFSILLGTVLQTATGIQFATTAAATFPASSTGPVAVAVQSTLAGANQQCKAGTITSIVSQITGSPSDLTVTNPLATAGADDAEKDDSLRDRARRFFVTARRGTLGAIVAGALAVAGVRTATAFESLDAEGHPARWVSLFVADAFTDTLANLDTIPPAYAVQAQTLATAVFAGLDDVRAAGIYVSVTVASVVLQAIHLALVYRAGVDEDAVATAAVAAAVNYTNSLAPGVSFVASDCVSALRTVDGLVISGSEIVVPAGTVAPAALQVIRTTAAMVSVV